MSWPIPEIRRQQRPASLKFWRWALWFFIVMLGGSALILAFWSQFPNESNFTFGIRLVLIPLLVFILTFMLRLSWHWGKDNFVDAWDREIENVYHRHRQWAKRHLTVMDGATITPHEHLAARIRGESTLKAPFMPGENRAIVDKDAIADNLPSTPRDVQYWVMLLNNIKSSLLQIQHEGELEIILSGALDPYDASTDWDNAWRLAGLEQPYSLQLVKSDECGVARLGEWIDQHNKTFRLLVMTHLGPAERLKHTESVQMLLLAPPDWYTDPEHYQPVATLYRPLPTTLDDLSEDLSQLNHFGAHRLDDVSCCWMVGLPEDKRGEVVQSLSLAGMNFKQQGVANRIFFLEDYLGLLADNSPWLLLSLAIEKTLDLHHEANQTMGTGPQLVMISHQQELWILLLNDPKLQG